MMVADEKKYKCYFCRKRLKRRDLMWTKVRGELVPCHRDCSKVWFFNEYGYQIGGAYGLPDSLSHYKRGKHG